MYSVLIDEQVTALQFAEPEAPTAQQVAAQGGGGALTDVTSSLLVVTTPPSAPDTRNIEPPQAIGTGASPTFSGLTITNLAAVGDLSVGGAETIKLIDFGTVAADPGNIVAQTRGSVDVTITGVAVGDIVLMNPPDGLNTGLVYGGCRVTATNTVRIYLANITGADINDGNLTYNYVWFDIT